jgi:hypothetical protein
MDWAGMAGFFRGLDYNYGVKFGTFASVMLFSSGCANDRRKH